LFESKACNSIKRDTPSSESDFANSILQIPDLSEAFHSGDYLRVIVREVITRKIEVVHPANLNSFAAPR
jgi:hypothetical protein